jgi:hypothetical protein
LSWRKCGIKNDRRLESAICIGKLLDQPNKMQVVIEYVSLGDFVFAGKDIGM